MIKLFALKNKAKYFLHLANFTTQLPLQNNTNKQKTFQFDFLIFARSQVDYSSKTRKLYLATNLFENLHLNL